MIMHVPLAVVMRRCDNTQQMQEYSRLCTERQQRCGQAWFTNHKLPNHQAAWAEHTVLQHKKSMPDNAAIIQPKHAVDSVH
jgi:hypothetical protein